jgi:transcription termination factor NusB
VLNGVAPVANFRVRTTSARKAASSRQLQFRAMADFRPESVVQQVAPLKLLEARSKLADLRNKLAGNDKLEDILNDVLNNTEKLDSLRKTTEDKYGGHPRQQALAPQRGRRRTDTGLLDQIVEQSKLAKSSSEHERARDIISELVSQVMEGTVVISSNLSATIDARLAELDRMISASCPPSCTRRSSRSSSAAGPACTTW